MQEQYKTVLFLAFCLLITACSSPEKVISSQGNEATHVNIDSLTVYDEEEVEVKPKVVGGERWLAQSMVYPEEARKHGIRGEVIIKFIVLKSGKDINHTISQSVHPILDKAAIKTIKKASFEPGKIEGRSVNTLYTMPLTYRMRRF